MTATDTFEVQFFLRGRYYRVPVSTDYAASILVDALQYKGILVTAIYKNGDVL